MANAVPVNGKKKQAAPKPEVVKHEGESSQFKDSAEFEAHVAELVANEAPALITDEQVNQIGQERQYGRFLKATEVPYNVLNGKGEIVGERTCVRVDH